MYSTHTCLLHSLHVHCFVYLVMHNAHSRAYVLKIYLFVKVLFKFFYQKILNSYMFKLLYLNTKERLVSLIQASLELFFVMESHSRHGSKLDSFMEMSSQMNTLWTLFFLNKFV